MNAYLPPSARRGFRIAGLIAAVICMFAIAAGVFVVSYTGVRDMALSAGVTAHYARFYPWLFDAVLVVAAVAALSLRGALRAYAWLVILVLLGAVAAANAIHAMSVSLPKRPTEATVAAAPWAVLLIGFTLLFAMARQGLLPTRRPAAAADATSNGRPENGEGVTQVPLSALLADKPATRPGRAQAAPAATKTEPITTKTEQSAPQTEALNDKGEPVSPEPVNHKTEVASTGPATAKATPTIPALAPVITKAQRTSTEPVTPRTEPAASKAEHLAAKGEPPKTEAAQTQPVTSATTPASTMTEPAKTEAEPLAAKAEPAKIEAAQTEPAQAEKAEAAQSQPVTSATTPASAATPAKTEAAPVSVATPVSATTEPAAPATSPASVTSAAEPYPAAFPPPYTDSTPYPARTRQFTMRHQPMAAQPVTAQPVTEPERPVRRQADRDDPSDADAESAEPAALFNRLRSGPVPPTDDDEDQD